MTVFPRGTLCDLALRQLVLNPHPESVSRVALRPRGFPVRLQDPVHELHCRVQFPPWPLRLLPRRSHSAMNCIPSTPYFLLLACCNQDVPTGTQAKTYVFATVHE